MEAMLLQVVNSRLKPDQRHLYQRTTPKCGLIKKWSTAESRDATDPLVLAFEPSVGLVRSPKVTNKLIELRFVLSCISGVSYVFEQNTD